MNKIILKGGQNHYTIDISGYYAVSNGSVYVYMAKFDDAGKALRKHFLYQASEKDNVWIPAFYISDKDLGRWEFVISALDQSEITFSPYESPERKKEVLEEFADKIGLNLGSFQSEDSDQDHDQGLYHFLQGELVEMMERKLLSEELGIYRQKQENIRDYSRSVHEIIGAFYKPSELAEGKTSSPMYNALALICNKLKIRLAPYEAIVEASGKNFRLEDAARISQFMIREVRLEEKWYQHNAGYMIAYKENTEGGYSVPVACVPKGMKKYIEYDFSEKTERMIDGSLSKSYADTGYTIYQPLPNRSISLRDLCKFCIDSITNRDIIALLCLTLAGSLIGLLIPYLNQLVYDKFIPWGSESALWQFGGLMMSFTVGNLLFSIVKNMVVFRSTIGIEMSLQSAVYHRLYSYPENIYMKYGTSDLVERAASVSSVVGLIFGDIVVSMLSVVFSLLYLLTMFAYSKELTFIVSAMVLLHMLISFSISFLSKRCEKGILKARIEARKTLHQILSGVAKIKISFAENRMLLQYLKPYAQAKKESAKRGRLLYISENINTIFSLLYTIVMYYMMVNSSLNLSIGGFLAFTAAFGVFSAAMLQIFRNISKWQQMKPSLDKIKVLFDLAPEVAEDIQMFGKLMGKIEVSNVSFRYNEEDDLVLSNISFSICKGEYIGIVGSSGSGKSTLFRLLMGFDKPTSGKVYYDDKDIDSLDKRELRKCLGVVLQDGQLIAASIYDNIVIASGAITKEDKEKETQKVWQVLKDVGLLDDITRMPMGLETIITEGSSTISVGQRQRILIARAIFNNPSILYFDEATSALDNLTQAIVAESLNKLHITRVVIAHRLSTVKDCDRIFVIDKGQLVEMGIYNELMDRNGYFYQMAQRQTI